MSRPVQEQSIAGATGTGSGSQLETGGRITVSLFVTASTLDTANDTLTVDLEVSADGNNWVTLKQVTVADFADKESDGTHAAYTSKHGEAARYIRAKVSAFTNASADGDLSVDAYVSASGNGDNTYDYREV